MILFGEEEARNYQKVALLIENLSLGLSPSEVLQSEQDLATRWSGLEFSEFAKVFDSQDSFAPATLTPSLNLSNERAVVFEDLLDPYQRISWAQLPCTFGYATMTLRGTSISSLVFTDTPTEVSPAQAMLPRDDRLAEKVFTEAFASDKVSLAVSATAFADQIWQRLRALPAGKVTTYAALAKELGSGSRAVGRAISTNSIAYFLPCHRVIGSDGGLRGYRWGLTRKKAILLWESGMLDHQRTALPLESAA